MQVSIYGLSNPAYKSLHCAVCQAARVQTSTATAADQTVLYSTVLSKVSMYNDTKMCFGRTSEATACGPGQPSIILGFSLN